MMIVKGLYTWIWNDLKSTGFPYMQAVVMHDRIPKITEVLSVKIPLLVFKMYVGQLKKDSL